MCELDIYAGWTAILDCIFDEQDPDDKILDFLMQADPERYARLAQFLLVVNRVQEQTTTEVH